MATSVFSMADLQRLLDTLIGQGFEVIGPTLRDGAISYAPVRETSDLPIGYTEQQTPGHYRLVDTKTDSLFAYTMGPQSWKRYLLPAECQLFEAHVKGRRFEVTHNPDEPPRRALLGVRACELAAIKALDRVLLEGPFVSEPYRRRRQNTLIVAVNCTRAGDHCFCASMGTGPRVSEGYDLLITEVGHGSEALRLIEFGSEQGQAILEGLKPAAADEAQIRAAEEAIAKASESMGLTLNTERLPEILDSAVEHRHWEAIAERCLNCGNCTMVCPTCFCCNTEDATSLDGRTATRVIRWDSCHTTDFSYIHGGSIRASTMSRYRQWMMHKLAYWTEQFDTFGCVGCGRCITWCPVGIDITEEAEIFRKAVMR